MNIDNIKMIKPNNEEHISNINKDFTNIISGELKLNTGLASLIVNLVNSKVFSNECLENVRGGEDEKYTPKHFNDLAKIFVRDILEDNFKTFDKVKKQALKRAIKVAVALIKDSSLSKFTNNKSINPKGAIAVDSSKFSANMKKSFDSGLSGGVKDLSVKDCVSYANDSLNLDGGTEGSILKAQMGKVLSIITDEKRGYGNDFNELPADCRNNYVPLRNKLDAIIKHLKIEELDTDLQIYAGR